MQQMKEIWSVWGCTVWKTDSIVENVALTAGAWIQCCTVTVVRICIFFLYGGGGWCPSAGVNPFPFIPKKM